MKCKRHKWIYCTEHCCAFEEHKYCANCGEEKCKQYEKLGKRIRRTPKICN